MIVELNIGLDVSGALNNFSMRAQRVEQAVRFLRPVLLHSQPFVTRYHGPDGDTVEHGLFAYLHTNNLIDAVRDVYQLSSLLQQDCIAVRFPHLDRGVLIGPEAAKWGQFNPAFFHREPAEMLQQAA